MHPLTLHRSRLRRPALLLLVPAGLFRRDCRFGTVDTVSFGKRRCVSRPPWRRSISTGVCPSSSTSCFRRRRYVCVIYLCALVYSWVRCAEYCYCSERHASAAPHSLVLDSRCRSTVAHLRDSIRSGNIMAHPFPQRQTRLYTSSSYLRTNASHFIFDLPLPRVPTELPQEAAAPGRPPQVHAAAATGEDRRPFASGRAGGTSPPEPPPRRAAAAATASALRS